MKGTVFYLANNIKKSFFFIGTIFLILHKGYGQGPIFTINKDTVHIGFQSFDFVKEDFTASTPAKVLALYSIVKNAIVYEMDIRNIKQKTKNPDFLIFYRIYGKVSESIKDASAPGLLWDTNADQEKDKTLSEGTLIISFLAPASQNSVWEAYAPGLIEKDIQNMRTHQIQIRKAVHEILKKFDLEKNRQE